MSSTKLIAFYLPQFHPIPENDLWWGKGFTEWTKVAAAKPLYEGHDQPKIPADLGFYDLRLPQIREEQANLAKQYGIHGFCYYYYWFNGRKLLEQPLEAVLESGEPQFPYCICWANENWTRRWDGSEQEILMEQVHEPDTDERFIREILPFLKDPRYITLDGAPLLLVYRINLLPNPQQAVATWREVCREEGIEKLHVAAVQTFGLGDPRPFGCDSAVEFPPHSIPSSGASEAVTGLHEQFTGNIFDYREVAFNASRRPPTGYRLHPGVMLSWDNTPRRGTAGTIYYGSSPSEYEIWLRSAIERSQATAETGESLVFINAWNEWAEGTHLEPDKTYGRAWLKATRRALERQCDWRTVLSHLRQHADAPLKDKIGLLDDLEISFTRYERSLDYFSKLDKEQGLIKQHHERITCSELPPKCFTELPILTQGEFFLDQIDDRVIKETAVTLPLREDTFLSGWSCCLDINPTALTTESYLVFFQLGTSNYWFVPVLNQIERPDVTDHVKDLPKISLEHCGFRIYIDTRALPRGRFKLGMLRSNQSVSGLVFGKTTLTVA